MPRLTPRCSRFRDLANAASIVTCAVCINMNGAARENEESPARPPYHPYLVPALSFAEMASGDLIEREMVRSARVLFPELAHGTLPATEFGALVLPSFWPPSVVLFGESDGGTLVEKRELEQGLYLRDLTPDERPGVTTHSKALNHEIATASVSAIRRALANARPNQPPGDGLEWVVLDGVSFYFFSRGNSGRAHSPDSATEAGKLTRLVGVLEQFVDGEVEEQEVRMAAEDALRANHGSVEDR